MSIVGSIGVRGGGFGFSELLDRMGIERRLYTAGANKARLDPFLPERPEDVEFVQKLLDDMHARFKSWVRERRSGRLKADENELFDGSFMLGEKALALGLIDGLADIAGLVRELAGEKARPFVLRPRRRGLMRLLPRMVDGALNAIEERQARMDLLQ
jgi:ClpP class serine protease